MPNPTTDGDASQQPSRRQELISNSWYLDNYQFCPTAKTVLGVDAATEETIVAAVTCKRWTCGYCAQHKIRRLAFLTHNAQPNRLLTLTVDPKLHDNPELAWLSTRRKVPELMRSLRKEVSELEYLRVTECTKTGWPHYHLLMRSSFLVQKLIKARWQELTGATIVDIRKVWKTWSAYTYLVKYLTKLHSLEWTERHVSYSREFFVKQDLEKIKFPELERRQSFDVHPKEFLLTRYPDEQITTDGEGRWVVAHYQPDDLTPLDQVAARIRAAAELQHGPKQQSHMAGFEPPPAIDFTSQKITRVPHHPIDDLGDF